VAVVLLVGLFGWMVAAIHPGTGVLIAIVSGWTIGRMHLEGHVEGWVLKTRSAGAGPVEERLSWSDRIEAGWRAMTEIVGSNDANGDGGGSTFVRLGRSNALNTDGANVASPGPFSVLSPTSARA
jgi:uncharacterized membrane protein YraQ (UPF0718 family)